MSVPAPGSAAKLYTPRLLSLAIELAAFPLTEDLPLTAEARSRTCGSTIMLGVLTGDGGVVERVGLQVSACAIGQSSAAIMAMDARGRTPEDFARALAAIDAWLGGEGSAPQWPGFDALEPALPHPGRHGALLLPWKAMVEALSSPPMPR